MNYNYMDKHIAINSCKSLSRGAAFLIITAMLFAFAGVSNCSFAEAAIISTQQEIEMGEEMAKQLEYHFPLAADDALQERIQRIGSKLVAVSDARRNMPYTFQVLDVDAVNAMALPGGKIYVFKGLIELMPTDDELAGIIGHEVSHVVKRHSMGQYEKSLGTMLMMGGLFGLSALPAQLAAAEAISAGYSRDDERTADQMGFELAYRAGFNPYGMRVGLMKLDELAPAQKNDLFSDHPENKERIRLMDGYIAKKQIYPKAKLNLNGDAAVVYDGSWSLPPIKAAMGATRPLERALLIAGRIYKLTKLENYDGSHYILDRDDRNIMIYYDDRLIMTITPEDAALENIQIEDLAESYMTALRKWRQ